MVVRLICLFLLVSACRGAQVQNNRTVPDNATPAAEKSFQLTWEAADDKASQYQIRFGIAANAVTQNLLLVNVGDSSFNKQSPSALVSLSADQVNETKEICFQVLAINDSGESPPSNTACTPL